MTLTSGELGRNRLQWPGFTFALRSKAGIPIQHSDNVTKLMKLFRYIVLAILLGFSGCAHYHDRNLEPEKTLSSFEDRSLNNARLQSFLATNHSPSSASWQAPQEWDLDTLTLVAFYYHPT